MDNTQHCALVTEVANHILGCSGKTATRKLRHANAPLDLALVRLEPEVLCPGLGSSGLYTHILEQAQWRVNNTIKGLEHSKTIGFAQPQEDKS